ncbi:MAG TPA: hybrid sensor histidine kinase/response regulator [Candidatus Didemnitutus sp.]|jgi:signal transduction histidine kinase
MIPAANARILVIEDDPAIRATMIDLLELNGCAVSFATNGTDGLALAQRDGADVILTDLHMPGLDGFELIERLRADDRTRSIPVIICSASVEPERMRQGMDLGADDFIVKPFTEDQVMSSIRARLEKKALLDELDAFAHTVAHDLKNPIATLLMRVGLLQHSWRTTTEEKKLSHVQELETSIVRLNTIVEELLVLAGVGRQSVKSLPIEMAGVIQETVERVAHLLQKSGAQIDRPTEWPVALGHAPWVVEIWTNYLSNALKYGGSPPVVRMGADSLAERHCVRFWVQDNGAGLTAGQQAQLFQQFSRVTETRVKGHGLGLSIVRRIAEKLGGSVGVESQPGAGSRFWFELPAADPAPASDSSC